VIKGARGENYHVGPHLIVNNAREAVESYKRGDGRGRTVPVEEMMSRASEGECRR